MARFGMVLNLQRCVRCRTCYVTCKREHNIMAHPRDDQHPYEYYRLRYVEWEWGKYPTVRRSFVPVHCVQCENPVCAGFCPTEAIQQREDGIIQVLKEKCNGCGVCTAVCPYGAIYLGHDQKADVCDFCVERVDKGWLPTCVGMCPAGARIFGDLNDPNSQISRIVSSGRAKPLVLAGNENNSVYYIPSPNENAWNELEYDGGFKKALNKRRKDLPPIRGVL